MFTIQSGNLTVHDDLDLWEQAIRNTIPNGVNYLVFQQEIAPTTRSVHIQGFVAMSQKKRPGPLGLLFHVQPECFQSTNNGSAAQNRGYCTDDDKRAPAKHTLEWGEMPGGRGQRTDLDRANDILKLGQGTKRVIEEMGTTYMKYPGGMKDIASYYKGKRCKTAPTLIVSLYVFWGTSGGGKTTAARLFDPEDTYEMPDPVKGGTVWMPDYQCERTLIIPDYDGEYPYGTLKRMMDGTFTKFQEKGGHNYAEWDSVIITSNHHPREWYPHERSDVWIYNAEQGYPGPLQRRITNLVQFEGIWPNTVCTIDDAAIEGFPPTRAQLRSAPIPETPVRSPSPIPSASPDSDSYRSDSTPATELHSVQGDLDPVSPATLRQLDDLGLSFIDDTDLFGTVVVPAPITQGIPPSWLDDEAGEDQPLY